MDVLPPSSSPPWKRSDYRRAAQRYPRRQPPRLYRRPVVFDFTTSGTRSRCYSYQRASTSCRYQSGWATVRSRSRLTSMATKSLKRTAAHSTRCPSRPRPTGQPTYRAMWCRYSAENSPAPSSFRMLYPIMCVLWLWQSTFIGVLLSATLLSRAPSSSSSPVSPRS